jgi:transcription elongation factor SPT6
MAIGALDLDEEDVPDEHPSHVISLMNDPDNEKKLNKLNLDEFAVSMYETNEACKWHTLHIIPQELLKPFAGPSWSGCMGRFDNVQWGDATNTPRRPPRLCRGSFVLDPMVSMYSIDGVIRMPYLAERAPDKADDVMKMGQALTGLVIGVKIDQLYRSRIRRVFSRVIFAQLGCCLFRSVRHNDAWNLLGSNVMLICRQGRAEQKWMDRPRYQTSPTSTTSTVLRQKHIWTYSRVVMLLYDLLLKAQTTWP